MCVPAPPLLSWHKPPLVVRSSAATATTTTATTTTIASPQPAPVPAATAATATTPSPSRPSQRRNRGCYWTLFSSIQGEPVEATTHGALGGGVVLVQEAGEHLDAMAPVGVDSTLQVVLQLAPGVVRRGRRHAVRELGLAIGGQFVEARMHGLLGLRRHPLPA